jgi:hypothetical protein
MDWRLWAPSIRHGRHVSPREVGGGGNYPIRGSSLSHLGKLAADVGELVISEFQKGEKRAALASLGGTLTKIRALLLVGVLPLFGFQCSNFDRIYVRPNEDVVSLGLAAAQWDRVSGVVDAWANRHGVLPLAWECPPRLRDLGATRPCRGYRLAHESVYVYFDSTARQSVVEINASPTGVYGPEERRANMELQNELRAAIEEASVVYER